MIVWIIEAGEYEDKYIVGVTASLKNAVALVKQEYPADGWDEPKQEHPHMPEIFTLRNRGECYQITEYHVIGPVSA